MNPVAAILRALDAPSDQARRLAEILEVLPRDLDAIRLGPTYHYRPRTVAKRDGRVREVLAPSPALKRLQRRLLDGYLAGLPVHPAATAFRAGGSTIRHARAHAFGEVVATVDLRDFFGTTRSGRVRGFLASEGWRDAPLRALTRLCTYRGGLPQGASTSPCLSNLVNARLDERLLGLAARSGGVYTRYGDDLAFSWSGRDDLPGGFAGAVEETLAAEGYEVQPLKGWRISPIGARPVVTGLVLAGQGRIRVPWPLRLRLFWLRGRSWWGADAGDSARLAGLRGHIRSVESPGRRPSAGDRRRSAR